jgi:DNA-binding transcriptional ArsR family regulator
MSKQSNQPVGAADVNILAAMTHPLRRRLIDQLSVTGPATVGMLAESTGERVGSVSHHLRVLARNGLVSEAPDLARDRRESWWRVVKGSWTWSITNFADDPVAEVIARAAEEQQLLASVEKVQRWYASREEYDSAWAEAAYVSTSWIRATPSELAELADRMTEVVRDFVTEHPTAGDAARDGDPGCDDERESVFLFTYGIPVTP